MKRPSRSRPTSSAKPSSKRLIEIGDLTRLVGVSDPQSSPDGRLLALVRKHVGDKNNYVTNIWVAPIALPPDGATPEPGAGTAGQSRGVAAAGSVGGPRQVTNGQKDRQPRFSHDGSTLAFVSERVKSHPQVHLLPIAGGGESRALTKFPEGSIGNIAWSPDGTLLAVAFRPQESAWTEAARKAREEVGESDPPRVIDDPWYRLDGDGYFNAQRYELQLIDVATGDTRLVYRGDVLGTFSFDFAPDSSRLVLATNRHPQALLYPEHDELLLWDVATGELTAVPNLPPGPKGPVAWSPDGKWIAYAGRLGTDGMYSVENLELFVCDPQQGQPRSLTAQSDECLLATCLADSVEASFTPRFVWTPDSRRLLVKIGRQGCSQIASVAVSSGKLTFLTTRSADHDLGGISKRGGWVGLCVGTPTTPSEAGVGKLEGDRLEFIPLSAFNQPLCDELELSEPVEHWITSADGNKVHVWMLLPPERRRKAKMPAVLEIHGGPHAQYGVGFFHEFQVLAAQGYVVVYSNPRGSKGYGRDHCAAIRGNWGTADWVDIQAVIQFMRSQPVVDTKRMGVMGGSYGGYMTNWVIGHTREFAAAITDRCVSNLVSMFGSSDLPDLPDSYFPGNSWDRPEALWNMSPLKYLGEARTPTLIIHSEGDLRCNVEQAEQVHTALHLNGVPTRFVRYPRGSSHGLSRSGPPDLRQHRLAQILQWWAKYLR